MEAASETTTQRPKRRRTRKALWLGLFVVLLIVGGRWIWRQAQFSRLRPALVQAVKAGDTKQVEELLEAGADPDTRYDYQSDLLTWHSLWRILRGEKSAASSEAPTVLMEAITNGNPAMARSFLKHGANVHLIGTVTRFNDINMRAPALISATELGSTECVRLLLAHGAKVNGESPQGVLPLCSAMGGDAMSGHLTNKTIGEGCVALLLAQGADVNGGNNADFLPLLDAVYFADQPSSSALVELLLRHGADVHLRDRDGRTPSCVLPKLDIWQSYAGFWRLAAR